MSKHETTFTPHPMPTGIVEVHGNKYMADGTGGLRALEAIKPHKLLCDELVRGEFGFALALADQIARFKAHLIANLGAFDALMAQEYGVTVGGKKGNRTYTSHDALWKIEVRIQDRLSYSSEIQQAKALFDECLNEQAADAPPLLRSIVTNAFDTDKEGMINRTNIHVLLNTEDDDPRWKRGQEAIRDAEIIISAKEYVRFSMRASFQDPWRGLTIDLANA